MRRQLLCLTALLLIALGYVAWPFLSLWTLRAAIQRGDTATIEQMVEWPTVRASLKASLAQQANLLPMATAAGTSVTPSIWQRVKGMFGASMLDRFIDTYVTPEGLPKLFDYRRMWREQVSTEAAEPTNASPLERVKRFWDRVKRAEFQTPMRVEFELEDRRIADRRYVSVMELQGFGWRLTELRVISTDPAKRVANLVGEMAR